jgi:hypothetical protein
MRTRKGQARPLGLLVPGFDLAAAGTTTPAMARAGIEPATPRFSVVCSTN